MSAAENKVTHLNPAAAKRLLYANALQLVKATKVFMDRARLVDPAFAEAVDGPALAFKRALFTHVAVAVKGKK